MLEDVEHIVKLTVNVSENCDLSFDLEHIWLLVHEVCRQTNQLEEQWLGELPAVSKILAQRVVLVVILVG